MVNIILCIKDIKQEYRVSAYGKMEQLADDASFGQHIGKILPFTIEKNFADSSLIIESLKGIISTTTHRKFYEFEIVSGQGLTGYLKIIDLSIQQSCLSADAP